MGGSTDSSFARIHEAGCAWDLQLCADDLNHLRSIDPGAWRVLIAMIRRSSSAGLEARKNGRDYRVPVGDKVRATEFKRRPKPWLGELKVDERTRKRPSKPGQSIEHRLYFGEPDKPETLVLGVSLREKSHRDPNPAAQQTVHIRDAMWKVIFWCEEREPPVGWRSWK